MNTPNVVIVRGKLAAELMRVAALREHARFNAAMDTSSARLAKVVRTMSAALDRALIALDSGTGPEMTRATEDLKSFPDE